MMAARIHNFCGPEVIAKNFKQDFIKACFARFANKPGSTYGTVNAGICERFIPGYKSP
jgi:hypothetical protein